MERVVGTVVRGLRTPIIAEGDGIVDIIVEAVLKAARIEGFAIRDRDIVAVTESVVARAQGNYVHLVEIARDVQQKFAQDAVGVVFPILSRNRFALILKGIAQAAEQVILVLRYPTDEVGNPLVDPDRLDARGVNPWTDELSETQFRDYFGVSSHPFTGIDYISYYKSILAEYSPTSKIVFSNNPKTVLKYTKSVLVADVHDRARTKRLLLEGGAQKVYGLDDILTKPTQNGGYNPEYGLLGSNKATENRLKLFPRDCQGIVEEVQLRMKALTGQTVEVLVYGDGAFKDPVGGIWELADPVVSPAFTSGLAGTPSEVKLKYLADQRFADLRGQELGAAVKEYLQNKKSTTEQDPLRQGTTPRMLTDLLGSLADLTSGSGDKGTPVVYIQGYFDNYAK